MKSCVETIFIICIMLVMGCQSSIRSDVYYFNQHTSVHLPNLTLSPTIETHQLLTITSDKLKKKEEHILTILSLSPKQLTLTLLSPLGVRLAQLQYDGNEIKVTQQLKIANITLPSLSQIVGDILLSSLPIEAWRFVLPQGWRIVEQNKQRLVFDLNQQKVIQIDYSDQTYTKAVKITHYQFLYQILLQDIE
ncbi:hypothetical protein QV08_09985 [Gallibacterium salpingitidis]|uniref:DUF3261 domain-containing protein n=1 Tax=Gallibacterium salpingitidis TaxID=505341 RepID=A0A1A7P3Z4_9PAST|nr:DUF3261 domain-containing protein [Gallibacterium salpingitidis]OBW96451.1 hypothetical protein QS62_00475 [Gallibacterium salpingitidis]OBX06456.1 hypothetical protein QV08_09985 [Gallibacterium salpingitidis]OBX08917.1 hypothetical protein QV09_09320 [Gallibacterium salpingitidis]WKS99394.1 DUF3261 domain-containing protein [Gallibacterium salpingitidis]